MNTDQTFAIILILTVSVIFGIMRAMKGSIGQALARRLSGKLEVPDQDGEIAELRSRLAELEERVDFTERVLLQQQERTQLPAGGDTP